MSIHQTAIIHPTAQLADDVEVGPYAIIEEQVIIGKGSTIGPHARRISPGTLAYP